MEKEISSLKLKVVGTLKTSLIIFVVVFMFSFELGYVHTRDSSRADLTASSCCSFHCHVTRGYLA